LACASLSFSCGCETFAAHADDESVMTQTVKKRHCMIDIIDNDFINNLLCSRNGKIYVAQVGSLMMMESWVAVV